MWSRSWKDEPGKESGSKSLPPRRKRTESRGGLPVLVYALMPDCSHTIVALGQTAPPPRSVPRSRGGPGLGRRRPCLLRRGHPQCAWSVCVLPFPSMAFLRLGGPASDCGTGYVTVSQPTDIKSRHMVSSSGMNREKIANDINKNSDT